MKKPVRKVEAARRVLERSELAKVRGGGGITAMDDWEAPVTGNKVWSDDWLAPV